MSRDSETVVIVQWHDIDKEQPPENQLLMVTGLSGYRTHPDFLCLAYYDEKYRPRLDDGEIRWLDVTNTALSDFSFKPLRWAYPINLENT